MKGCTLMQGDLPIAFNNALQDVPLCLNKKVFEVMEHCFKNMISIGKFRRLERREITNNLTETSTEEEIKSYKRLRRELEDANAQIERDNCRTTELVFVARKFINETRIYLCYSFCYRGRIYTLQTALSPQGCDPERSLFLFADEGAINEWWLAFHTATCWGGGLDKAELNARVEWTRSNTDLITEIATDPCGTIKLWRDADEPWSALASMIEYYDCCIAQTKKTSGIPCGIDATASGIQHLAASTLDATSSRMVNLLPTKKPVDAYGLVAEKSKEYLPEKYHSWMTRNVTKRTTMCLPYGLSRHGSRGYLRDSLISAGHELETGDLTTITSAVYEKAIPEIFPGPINVMNWIKRSVKELMRDGTENLTWVTPSGFVVRQDLRKPTTRRINTHLMGVGRITASVYQGPGEVDATHHVSATSPNLVHSWDASLLCFVFTDNGWGADKPFSVIHDCVMARSCDMDDLASEVRVHFAEMYKGDPLQDWADQLGIKVPDGLIIGDLDLDQVNQSDYFFS